jgi:carbamoyl-phosphate synthase small subunit
MREMNEKHQPAILALADGTVFHGLRIGAKGYTLGEVVFNTAMSGYQEILTDPSYADQIITFTYPHIGNVGINPDDMESGKIYASGLIIAHPSPIVSNWRSCMTLNDFLKKHNVIGIAEIDTRRLTRILREKGAQNGCIVTDQSISEKRATQLAQKHPTLNGKDLAKKVSTKKSYAFTKKTYRLPSKYEIPTKAYQQKKVIVLDFGIKHQTLKLLNDRNCTVTVVSAQTTATDILKLKPDGVSLSNGPGDPSACDYAITCIKALLEKNIPLFGICLGCQLLALGCGAQTFKMKFGHHGSNHPVQDLRTNIVSITSQNHGFAIDESSLPSSLDITHRSLFDHTIQGIKHRTKSAIGFQGHPEASPGPHDIEYLFDEFMEMMHAKTN